MEKLKIGITQGDFNGVGYETILKVLSDPRMVELCTPVIYGSAKIAAFYRKTCNLPEVKLTQIASAQEIQPEHNCIINITPESAQPEPGTPSVMAGQEAANALRAATTDLKEGWIDALVTCPINKETAHSDEFPFTGHTEFLQDQLEGEALMMLCKDNLRVALVTIHEPIDRVAEKVTTAEVLSHIKALNSALKQDFAVHAPRIAVLALDPHGGDNGVIGTRDRDQVVPAIEQAREDNILAFGPYPADGFFGSGNYTHFDGILAMYHDQGLAPFKVLAQNQGVNFTAGLEGIRTSPGHGTAFDIAGRGEADEQSLRNAIYMAIDIARNRANYRQALANPLKRSEFQDRRPEHKGRRPAADDPKVEDLPSDNPSTAD